MTYFSFKLKILVGFFYQKNLESKHLANGRQFNYYILKIAE